MVKKERGYTAVFNYEKYFDGIPDDGNDNQKETFHVSLFKELRPRLYFMPFRVNGKFEPMLVPVRWFDLLAKTHGIIDVTFLRLTCGYIILSFTIVSDVRSLVVKSPKTMLDQFGNIFEVTTPAGVPVMVDKGVRNVRTPDQKESDLNEIWLKHLSK